MIARLRKVRATREGGYTVIEMLTVLLIMGIVMSGLTTIFVSGSKAETNMNQRFTAQQNTRLALDRIRRDIHCAYDITPYATSSMTIKSTGCGDVSWCTALMTGYTNRYGLYRQSGSTCSSSTGTRIAQYLTTNAVFTAFTKASGYLAALTVDFPVKVASAAGTYRLTDTIYLRNSTRS